MERGKLQSRFARINLYSEAITRMVLCAVQLKAAAAAAISSASDHPIARTFLLAFCVSRVAFSPLELNWKWEKCNLMGRGTARYTKGSKSAYLLVFADSQRQTQYLYKEEDIMCNKLNRLNMEAKKKKIDSPDQRARRQENVTIVQCDECEFLIQFKYETVRRERESGVCASTYRGGGKN